ncbi:ABC transporter ATP-binding protein [Teichococcus cervicalis]|uniref:ABC transporter ATP-binding protein n=1 Tax=Teichococcus cervicalis TaxID=204525 RepID=UPI0036D408D9
MEPGEILCLLGPSGDGKTTLLRLAAGLEAVQQGRILIGGQMVAEKGREVPPEGRRAGFVFQDYALFPHLTVAGNVGFGLRQGSRAERAALVAEALGRVGLAGHAAAYPHMLSGGQQQRVALARALAPRPAVLLLDEAFASLDARLRERVRDDTLHVLQSAGIATLIVTHDAEEAMFMADRIALMRGGRVEQLGTPEALYLRPASRFVATFLGEVNTLPARIAGGVAETALGSAPAALPDGPAELLLRPEGLRLLPPGEGLAAEVQACRLLGAHFPGASAGAAAGWHGVAPACPAAARPQAGARRPCRFGHGSGTCLRVFRREPLDKQPRVRAWPRQIGAAAGSC